MNCLRISQIYQYLEKELPILKNKTIEEHLSTCPKCQKFVEERRVLLQAAESLSSLEVPSEFTRQVMAKLFCTQVSPHSFLIAISSVSSITIAIFIAYFLLSGRNLLNLLVTINHNILDLVLNISTLIVKILALATLLIKLILHFSEFLFKSLIILTSIINPEVQITLMILSFIIIIFIAYLARRKIWTGEKI